MTNKTIYARIDRPSGVINFSQAKDPSEVLNECSHNLNSLMMLVSKKHKQRRDGTQTGQMTYQLTKASSVYYQYLFFKLGKLAIYY